MTNGDWQCADGGHLDDLHLRAASRDYHAPHELASRLTERDMHSEPRELASAADADSGW